MRSFRRVIAVLLPLTLVTIASAWVDSGHMVIAAIAYGRLTPRAKAEADRLLKFGGTERTRDFITAACWADDIRRDRSETGKWHYIDFYFRSDGKPAINKPDAENAVWAIAKFKQILGDKSQSDENRAEALRFLIHFVGDIHQPLHAVSRETDQLPKGDAGGNKFPIEPPPSIQTERPLRNLHSLWDLGCGLFPSTTHEFRPLNEQNRAEIEAIAHKIEMDRPATRKILSDVDPLHWAETGLEASKKIVYDLPEGSTPSEAYLHRGEELSETRAAEAGYRLAGLLNSVLK